MQRMTDNMRVRTKFFDTSFSTDLAGVGRPDLAAGLERVLPAAVARGTTVYEIDSRLIEFKTRNNG